ncbi:hypothetical protein [Kiritimatiella glycovorans]|uniref:Uroporphyrinogen decarboxylase (URO-D) domain-containing protein n=1 Tax=Kiritimatiella glycovorans TaxID=1307763 RepID=A0A0G3ELF2_9BACT|nr:hypothetical protein [Kiritimatiella glycovorans]AKJ65605.1 hypothetical protein L21SP4_02379 [Kiritimatiella glycovorans]
MSDKHDIQALRETVKRYLEVAYDPIQEERRRLWSAHHAFKPTPPPIFVMVGMFNAFCKEMFGDAQMKCADPLFREHERWLKMRLFVSEIGDDQIIEPWLTQGAAIETYGGRPWGLAQDFEPSAMEGGAMKMHSSLDDWSLMNQMHFPHHCVDENLTRAAVEKIGDAVGDLIPIDVNRGPLCQGTRMDISTDLAQLRGLETIMTDMYEYPDELHKLLAYMRDGILANHREAEDAGHWTLTSQINQTELYSDDLERPKPNSGPRRRRDLWACCMAQELTLVSPEFHDIFMLQYQIPIMKEFGAISYGCCENLTEKIDILRQIPNLRIIAVTPSADPKRCAEQIGSDYIISYRPNPTDMICGEFNEDRIRRILRRDLAAMRGGHVQINLKDIETVERDPDRLRRWTRIAREVIDEVWE